MGAALADCRDLAGYLEAFGPELARQALGIFDPLHVPGRDRLPAGLGELARPLYPAQADAAAGAVAVLRRHRSAMLIADIGSGKTPMALGIGHALGAGKSGYRALVMCPDHLIPKWARHVRAFVPGARVFGYDPATGKAWDSADWLRLAANRPGKPTGPEWYILGRDKSKFDPAWEPAAVERRRLEISLTRSVWYADDEEQTDLGPDWSRTPTGRTYRRADGSASREYRERRFERQAVWTCPRCGVVLADREGIPRPLSWLATAKRACQAPAPEPAAGWPDDPGFQVPKCGEPLWTFVGRRPARKASRSATIAFRTAEQVALAGWSAAAAGRWQARRTQLDKGPRKSLPWRWAPARTIQARLRGFFDLFALDEMHEEKAEESAQAIAAGKLIASARKTLGLTGTLMGGYAWHLFPLLFRLAPGALIADGFAWGDLMKFTEKYGRVQDRIEYPGKPDDVVSHAHSMGRSRAEKSRKTLPGIVLSVFGDHLLERTIFLRLEQISAELPPRPVEEVIAVPMDPDMGENYRALEAEIRQVIAPMLRRGDISLLGRMLHGLLSYPDLPYGYAETGYFAPFGIAGPPELPAAGRVYPKEAALLEIVRAEAARGRQVWVYVQQTDVRDVRPRLAGLFRAAGLTADILHASVDRLEREAWIRARGPRLNVAISHPMLVQTGLELFDPEPGGSNFATIVFYQTGYNPFTLLQAGGRAWRIGQPKDCRTIYLYYEDTMQANAIELMGKKITTARILGGDFSAEGLGALADDTSLELALARSLIEQVRAVRPAGWAGPVSAPLPRVPAAATPAALPAPEPPRDVPAVFPARPARAAGRKSRDLAGQLMLWGNGEG